VKKFKFKSRLAVICTLIIMLLTSIMPTKMANAAASVTNSAPVAPATITAISVSYNSIKTNWAAVTGASGYEVYRATTSAGYYSLVSTVTSTNYTNTGLSTGTTYYYKVRAYTTVGTSKVFGNYSKVVSAKPIPATPTSVTAASASYNSIKTSWAAVTGASGYEVYRAATSTGAYTLLSTIASTSCTNTGLSTGTAYYYKVRAYKTVGTAKVFGNYSTVVSGKPIPATPASVTAASASYNSIKTSWAAVTGASGYEVYRAATSTGAYTLLSTIAGTSYTNIGLSTGTAYYYKVRAYKTVGTTKIFGNYSTVVSAKPIPASPASVTAALSSYNGIKTTWAAVGGANGYEVYRATTSTGNYSLVSTVTSTNYTNTGLAAGTTYYYKIRAYTTVGTTKVYSNYSSVVSANNKEGYVYNTNLGIDLNVRSAPSLNGTVVGHLFNYQKVQILATTVDSSNNVWDKIIFNGGFAYVSHAYIQLYTSPPDDVVKIASDITKQFEVGIREQYVGNFDGQGLSLGYLQWCIGQGTLQPLLHRMDRQYNSEVKSIFGTNYISIHNMLLDTQANQLTWAKNINDSANHIKSPWNTQLDNLTKNQHFISIEKDAEVYFTKQAMIICDKYKLRTVRGFALAFDIAVQNGSISSSAGKIIDAALLQNPKMTEKQLLAVVAKAVSGSSPDILSRKMTIVNGQGTVHEIPLNLDVTYRLSDSYWR